MRGGASAGRAELHLGLVFLGVGDKFLEIVHRQVRPGDQRDRSDREIGHRREVRYHIVQRPLVERLVLGVRSDAAEHHRVAVWLCVGDALEPVMPPAPPTFSTTTCWPSNSLMRCAMTRPIVSCGPPAANGMTIVTGRVGKSWAVAWPAETSAANAAASSAFFIVVLQ